MHVVALNALYTWPEPPRAVQYISCQPLIMMIWEPQTGNESRFCGLETIDLLNLHR